MLKSLMKKRKTFIIITVSTVLSAILLILLLLPRGKAFTVIIDGEQNNYITYKDTVKEALDDKGIKLSPKDKIDIDLNSKLVEKSSIHIKKAVDVKVSVDGKKLDIQSSEDDIGSMLNGEGIILKEQDKITPDKSAKLSEGMEIDITRVETKALTETIPISFNEVVKEDSSLLNTKKKILQEGKTGEKQILTSVVYEDGIEVSRKVVSETITKKPVDRIILQGTYPYMPVSRSGEAMPYTKVFKAKATAYWAVRGVGKTYTASGRLAVRDSKGYSTIAVDPNVIPYGTKLFVEGYGFAIAADTGTAIIGDTIDVFFNSYNEACKWGLKYVNVYILK